MGAREVVCWQSFFFNDKFILTQKKKHYKVQMPNKYHFWICVNIILLMLAASILEEEEEDAHLTLKQKVYLFQEKNPRKLVQNRMFSTIDMLNPEYCEPASSAKKVHSALKPKLPSKKLFDEPKFFLSLERRKMKILDGLKKVAEMSSTPSKEMTQHKKRRERGGTFPKRNNSELWNEQDWNT